MSIRRDDDILDKVVVSSEGLSGDTIVLLFLGDVPDDEGLISGSSEEGIRVVREGGDTGDPSVVSLEDSSELHCVGRHFD